MDARARSAGSMIIGRRRKEILTSRRHVGIAVERVIRDATTISHQL